LHEYPFDPVPHEPLGILHLFPPEQSPQFVSQQPVVLVPVPPDFIHFLKLEYGALQVSQLVHSAGQGELRGTLHSFEPPPPPDVWQVPPTQVKPAPLQVLPEQHEEPAVLPQSVVPPEVPLQQHFLMVELYV
jgi:hypothetical protein